VNGDLTIDAGANALFDGLIYVTGDVSITGPAQISGSLVVGGNLSVDGGGDIATIQYDTTVLSALRQQIGQYRISQNEQYVFSDGNSR